MVLGLLQASRLPSTLHGIGTEKKDLDPSENESRRPIARIGPRGKAAQDLSENLHTEGGIERLIDCSSEQCFVASRYIYSMPGVTYGDDPST